MQLNKLANCPTFHKCLVCNVYAQGLERKKIIFCNISCFDLGGLELCLGGLNAPKPTRGDGTDVNVLLHSLTAAVFP